MGTLKKLLHRFFPNNYFSCKYPISIKAIVEVNNKILLLKNERNEWELPGGKIEENETTEVCVIREIKEELGIEVMINNIVDVWLYTISGKAKVLIVTYLCKKMTLELERIKVSNEHQEFGLFDFNEIEELNMPQGYKYSISKVRYKLKDE